MPGRRPGLRAYLLKPETGRTHQLRVAMKSLAAPILGDEVRAGADTLPLPLVAAIKQTGSRGSQVQMQRRQAGRRPGLGRLTYRTAAGLASPQRYARKEAAAAEDRTYLHCAAVRFTLAGQAVQVVCPPQDGAEFSSPEFAAVLDAWLPPALAGDWGTWFSDNKLLRSSLEAEGL